MNHDWNTLYNHVLDNGQIYSPRGRRTLECLNVNYSMHPHQHFDARPSRNISLNYIFREFLWFTQADRHDTRMAEYAPIWKTCISADGGINSNYGQYIFADGFYSPFCRALECLVNDHNSRRAWIPIFQTFHQLMDKHEDYPCTTGLGFMIRNNALEMQVHMRSQDMWWGAANDEPVCFLMQLLAQAYLKSRGVTVPLGQIHHKVDSLHFYERHLDQAFEAAVDFKVRDDVWELTSLLLKDGFSELDMIFLLSNHQAGYLPSPVLQRIMNIPGAYGEEDLL